VFTWSTSARSVSCPESVISPPGMWRRGRVYYARFRGGGREIRKRLSSDYSAACVILNDLRARADKLDFGLLDNDCSWAELKIAFLRWARQGVRNPNEYESDLAKFEQFVRVVSIREVDHQLVIGFRAWRLSQGVTPRTINRQVGTIHNMLAKGVKWKRIGSNPLADLKPLKHDSPVKARRSLTVEEVRAIFDASPPYLRPVWKMFMTTGVRRSELVNLKFQHVNVERKVLIIPASAAKNHKAREIPLDDEILTEIVVRQVEAKGRQLVAGHTRDQTDRQRAKFSREHVFVTNANTPLKNNLLKRFYAVCKRAGIEGAEAGGNVDLHSLRVTFITLAIEHGGSPKAVQAIVGHSSLAMTMGVYAKATDSAKREAIGALPFAKVTAPAHIVSLQIAHKSRTSPSTKAETRTA
jgi:integrase